MTRRKAKAGKRNQETNPAGAPIQFDRSDLAMLYDRLRCYGYNNLHALLRDFISGKFPATMETQEQTLAIDTDFLRLKIHKLMSISGTVGLTIKIALLTGLRPEEVLYIYRQEICEIQNCDCYKLHIISKENGLSIVIINWFRDNKTCYLAILPTRLLSSFRDLVSFDSDDIDRAGSIMKQAVGIEFEQLRIIYCQVISTTMDASEVNVLSGNATIDAAKDSVNYGLDSMASKYCKAWGKFGRTNLSAC
jgi:hypothetical protein